MEQDLPLEISVADAKHLVDAGDVLLLDCRNQEEFDFVHLEGSTLIPMDEITTRVEELRDQRTPKHIVVYCHMGVRSNMVCQWLRQQGFEQVQSLAGGIDAWSQQIDPSLPRY